MQNKIKVLHVVGGDLTGGAARGAYWLHLALKDLGVQSKIYTNSRTTFEDDSITTINLSKVDKFLCFIRGWMDRNFSKLFFVKSNFSTGLFGKNFTKSQIFKDADIIHLHWINDGLVNIKHLSYIKKPIVWTLRDMWPMTEGHHVDKSYRSEIESNNRYLNKKIKFYIKQYFLYRKKKYYPKTMKIVGISEWLTECAKDSSIFRKFDVRTIHNNINIDDFYFVNKDSAKEALGLETNKKIILYGSMNLKNPWKGFKKFIAAISMLDKDEYFLCFFGKNAELSESVIKFEHINLGYLNDNSSLRHAYNSADVFVASSLEEPFGKTIAESMACNTPVVCFDATGPRDIISHKIDGFKAKPFDSKELSIGIDWICNSKKYDEICHNAREKVIKNFDSKVIAEKYLDLYRKL